MELRARPFFGSMPKTAFSITCSGCFASMIAKHPERVIEKAVYGMLPKSALGRQVLRGKLRVYPGAEHPHTAQQPKTLTFPKSEAK